MSYTLVCPPVNSFSPLVELQAWHKERAAAAKKAPNDAGLTIALEEAVEMLADAHARQNGKNDAG